LPLTPRTERVVPFGARALSRAITTQGMEDV